MSDYWKLTRWLTPTWWGYLLADLRGTYLANRWQVLLCRIKGHPAGIHFYNVAGDEPDYRCRNCGEWID